MTRSNADRVYANGITWERGEWERAVFDEADGLLNKLHLRAGPAKSADGCGGAVPAQGEEHGSGRCNRSARDCPEP